MREIETLNPLNMRVALKTLKNETTGMNPVQFESYCETNGIQTEWLEVTLTDFNDAVYHIALPAYGWRCVYSFNGSPIEFSF